MIKNNKGVTLVELLIVIVILGIIAAVSIPAVGSIVQNSQRDAVISEASSLRSALNTCIAAGDCSSTDLITDTGNALNYTSSDNDFIYDPTTQVIAVIVGDYYFIGNPSSAGRDAVIEITGDVTNVIDDSGASPVFDETASTGLVTTANLTTARTDE